MSRSDHTSRPLLLRLLIDVSLVLAILTLPWWVSVLLIIVGSWKYAFYEGMFAGLLLDLLYDSHVMASIGSFNIYMPFLLTAFALFILLPVIKQRVRLYS